VLFALLLYVQYSGHVSAFHPGLISFIFSPWSGYA